MPWPWYALTSRIYTCLPYFSRLLHVKILTMTYHRPKRAQLRGPIPTLLPVELLYYLVSHLDNCTIIALLKAFPKLTKYAVAITETPFSKPLVFFKNLTGVKRVSLAKFKKKDYPWQFIRLFEFDLDWLHEDANLYNASLDARTFQLMDSRSFVHATALRPSVRTVTFIRECLLPGAHAQIDNMPNPNQVYFSREGHVFQARVRSAGYLFHLHLSVPWTTSVNDLRMSMNSPLDIYKLKRWKELRELYIEGIVKFEGFTLPLLRKLTVSFVVPVSSDRPVIRALNLPHLSHFKVLYHRHFPLIQDVHACSERFDLQESWGQQRILLTHFELVHVYSKGIPAEDRDLLTTDDDMEDADLLFSRHFSSIKIVGGPVCLLRKIDFHNTRFLDYVATRRATKECPYPSKVYAPELHTYLVRSAVPNFTVPQIPFKKKIICLAFETWCTGFDPTGPIYGDYSELNSLCVHDYTFSRSLELTKQHFEGKPHLHHLSLIGCRVGKKVNLTRPGGEINLELVFSKVL